MVCSVSWRMVSLFKWTIYINTSWFLFFAWGSLKPVATFFSCQKVLITLCCTARQNILCLVSLKLTLPWTVLHYNTTVSYSACDTVLSSLMIIDVKASLPLAVTEDINCQSDFLWEGKCLSFGKSAWCVTSEQHPQVF